MHVNLKSLDETVIFRSEIAERGARGGGNV